LPGKTGDGPLVERRHNGLWRREEIGALSAVSNKVSGLPPEAKRDRPMRGLHLTVKRDAEASLRSEGSATKAKPG
jgi:hypothetical protein